MIRERVPESEMPSHLSRFLGAMGPEAPPFGRSSVAVEFYLRLLGLQHCADTVVGNPFVRGISGGEKKRVTLGESLVGGKKVLLCDDISTGLDFRSTHAIVSALQRAAHFTRSTCVVSLLQPPPEVVDLFDDVILLGGGRMVYHGPVEGLCPFFTGLGLRAPKDMASGPLRDRVDFVMSQTSPRVQNLAELALLALERSEQWRLRGDRDPGQFVSPAEMVERWEQQRQPQEEHSPEPLEGPNVPLVSSLVRLRRGCTYALGFWPMLLLLLRRDLIFLRRNRIAPLSRMCQVLVIGFIVGASFWRLPQTVAGGQLTSMVLYFTIVQFNFSGFSESAATQVRRPIFLRQRDNRWYSPAADVAAYYLQRLPFALVETTVWALVVYWMVNMAHDAGRFFVWWLGILLAFYFSSSLFRATGTWAPSATVAQGINTPLAVLIIACSGQTIVETSIPGWWIWFFWCAKDTSLPAMPWGRTYGCRPLLRRINPQAYLLRALVVNEFSDPRWAEAGPQVLRLRAYRSNYYWRWLGLLVVFCMTLVMAGVVLLGAYCIRAPPRTPLLPPDDLQHKAERKQNGAAGRLSPVSEEEEPAGDDARDADQQGPAVRKPDGDDLPFTPVAMSFRDVRYRVPQPGARAGEIELLRGISGCFRPGRLCALMGASGAGKTTLMDVLARRKNIGRTEGSIRLCGRETAEVPNPVFHRLVSYCEQQDLHAPFTTVEEAAFFSARLRLPKHLPDARVRAFVRHILTLLDLDRLRGSLVGMSGVSGLTAEQRKRLTIAVELAANPSLVFLDEPTSGLDARAARLVGQEVRRLADTGRTIVCTIHQPSKEVFELFDDLLLLKAGGECVYFGPLGQRGEGIIRYLEAVPGVPRCPEGTNPANWMLDVVGSEDLADSGLPAEQEQQDGLGPAAASAAARLRRASLSLEGTSPSGWSWLVRRSRASADVPAGPTASRQDLPSHYRSSGAYVKCLAGLARLEEPQAGDSPFEQLRTLSIRGRLGTYPSSLFQQYKQLFLRANRQAWRSPQFNYQRLVISVYLAVVFGSLYYSEWICSRRYLGCPGSWLCPTWMARHRFTGYAPSLPPAEMGGKAGTVQDMSNIAGALYLSNQFLGVLNTLMVRPPVTIAPPMQLAVVVHLAGPRCLAHLLRANHACTHREPNDRFISCRF